jgi:hypothetical protein
VPIRLCKTQLTFTLQAGQGHLLPLFDEKVSSVLAGIANLVKLLSHKFSFVVADALRKGTLYIDR